SADVGRRPKILRTRSYSSSAIPSSAYGWEVPGVSSAVATVSRPVASDIRVFRSGRAVKSRELRGVTKGSRGGLVGVAEHQHRHGVGAAVLGGVGNQDITIGHHGFAQRNIGGLFDTFGQQLPPVLIEQVIIDLLDGLLGADHG